MTNKRDLKIYHDSSSAVISKVFLLLSHLYFNPSFFGKFLNIKKNSKKSTVMIQLYAHLDSTVINILCMYTNMYTCLHIYPYPKHLKVSYGQDILPLNTQSHISKKITFSYRTIILSKNINCNSLLSSIHFIIKNPQQFPKCLDAIFSKLVLYWGLGSEGCKAQSRWLSLSETG